MLGRWINRVPGSLALVARGRRWWSLSWSAVPSAAACRATSSASMDDTDRRFDRFRYHLGRGRRAREAGRFEHGSIEARRALALSPADPWALALLGQCLRRQRHSDLASARRALERAWALDPTNGYFVRLLLDVLHAQGDTTAARDVLEWAWWRGAPVERWLPGRPPIPARERRKPFDTDAQGATPASPNDGRGPLLAGRQSVPA